MTAKKVLITGSAGLIGSEAVRFFAQSGFRVTGIDNDMRCGYFGRSASTRWNLKNLLKDVSGYKHVFSDIRNAAKIKEVFKKNRFHLILHTAAQPSHEWASKAPLTDFEVNASATLGLLENFRKYSPESTFVFLSSNKVYGDQLNRLAFRELKTRFELADHHPFFKGINETLGIDRCLHTLFGASKASADLLVQEYGLYFKLRTICLRAGCVTGSLHSGSEMHGFLSYLGYCIAEGKNYTVYGYQGKQVRDNIHSQDLVGAISCVCRKPSKGGVYNIGGGRESNISILEAIKKFEASFGKKAKIRFIDTPRTGDHIWYISDMSKFKNDHPDWQMRHTIDSIIEEICRNSRFRKGRKKS